MTRAGKAAGSTAERREWMPAQRESPCRAALLAAGADVDWTPSSADTETAFDTALTPDTCRSLLATWLDEPGAVHSRRYVRV